MMYRNSVLRNKTFVCWFGSGLCRRGRLVDDGEGEDLAGAGRAFWRGRVRARALGRKETKLTIAQSIVEDDFEGGRADLLAREIDLVAKRA